MIANEATDKELIFIFIYITICNIYITICKILYILSFVKWAFQVALLEKNLPANAGDLRNARSSGEGHGNPLHYSCLENPMDRGAWRATVCKVAKSKTRLKQLSIHAWICKIDS